jgi:hypothetical protein
MTLEKDFNILDCFDNNIDNLDLTKKLYICIKTNRR